MKLEKYLDSYYNTLFDGSVESNFALNYLVESRGLDEATIREISIGYCPKHGDVPGDTDSQKRGNYSLNGGIIMPIRSEFNDVVALAARKPQPEEKGWWNQRFDKGNHIFLFDRARRHIYEQDKVYLVEGYFDAVIPWQYGIKNIGCLMGTTLGMRRISLISRYCENVCVMFDTDAGKDGKEGAGQKAQRRAIAELALAGIKGISSIDMPLGVDPDQFVIKNGADALRSLEKVVTPYERNRAKKEHLDNR